MKGEGGRGVKGGEGISVYSSCFSLHGDLSVFLQRAIIDTHSHANN